MANYRHLGDFFIVGIEGVQLSLREREMLSELSPLGVILFAKNIDAGSPDWPLRLKNLLDDCRGAARRDDFLVSIDHEGGRVHRFPEPVTRFPAARSWAGRAEEVGAAMGRELRSLGFDLDFAPVLDVHADEDNRVIGERAFSNKAEEVALPALQFLNGLQSQGVLGCIKHFPGHGSTKADSHFELPELCVDRSLMDEREIRPFRELISAHDSPVSLLMSAHVRYPCLDENYPATLSRKILTDLLRSELGYRGAVITDDLGMGALQNLAAGERAVRCLSAGCDILLPGNPPKRSAADEAFDMAIGLEEARQNGILPESRFNEASERVATLLTRFRGIREKSNPALFSLSLIGSAEHRTLLSQLTA